MTCLATPSRRASSVCEIPFAIRMLGIKGAISSSRDLRALGLKTGHLRASHLAQWWSGRLEVVRIW